MFRIVYKNNIGRDSSETKYVFMLLRCKKDGVQVETRISKD